MRLIDADELIKDLKTEIPLAENVKIFVDIIKGSQTAYDVDKVVEKIESCFNATEGKGRRLAYHRAIEIVKGGGVNGDITD